MNNRLAYIDLVRAYAIFLVTGFHLWRFFGRPSEEIFIYDAFAIFEKGWGGVELFFIISGFSMALVTYKNNESYKTIDWQKYFAKRLFRILPAYYVAIIIWSILIYNGIAPKPIGLIDQLSHLLFIHTFNPNTYYSISGVFWSLGIEMQFYFLLPLLLFFIVRYPLLSILLFLLPLIYNNFISKSFLSDKTVFAFFIYFVMGYITYIYKEKYYDYLYNNKYRYYSITIFSMLFLHITFYKGYIFSGQIHMLLWVLSFIPILIFLTKSTVINNSKSKLLDFFIFTGTASYSIYLYNYIFYIHKKPFGITIEALFFYTLLIYITGIAMYYLIEKPFQRLRKRYIK